MNSFVVVLIFANSWAVHGVRRDEEPCLSDGGNCMLSSQCKRPSALRSGRCPSQAGNIMCCLQYDEAQCTNQGGNCMSTYKACSGTFRTGLCPTQVSYIMCCIGSSGGSGASASSGSNLDSVLAYLKIREGFKSTGYIPTAGSGVTIGIGIDLGQQSESGLRSLGVSEAIIQKVKPYLGYKTRAAVAAAGLVASNLKLTTAEATDLSRPFVEKEAKVAAQYGTKMSQNGRDVLASLRHWAGSLGNTRVQPGGGKLAVNVRGQATNFVWAAIKNKDATDAQLKAALQETFKYHTKGTAAYNRIKAEIGHL